MRGNELRDCAFGIWIHQTHGVEIVENKCEGMVRIRDLKDDYYTFDPREYALVGERKGKMYQLGDEVEVMVKNTDLVKRHLDFSMVGKA